MYINTISPINSSLEYRHRYFDLNDYELEGERREENYLFKAFKSPLIFNATGPSAETFKPTVRKVFVSVLAVEKAKFHD